jgi:hypothetical protein
MNLEHWIKNWFVNQRAMRLFLRRPARLGDVFFGQNVRLHLESLELFMSLSLLFARRAAICFCCGLAVGIPGAVFAQASYYTTNGTEYAMVGSLPGDQVFPCAAVKPNGGFVVWQDNITDGSGWGISARRLDGTMSGTLNTFRVNARGTNDQVNPRVALLKNGGAAFVWQGGAVNQHIYARFLMPTNGGFTFLTTTDLVVSTFTNSSQLNPAVAALNNNSNVVVVWSSFNQAGPNTLLDVYGQILSTNGTKIGTNFLINQFTSSNQRTPAIAALKNGGFVVAWVSEQQRTPVSGMDNSFYNTGGAAYVSTNENGIADSNNTNYMVSANAVPSPSVDIYARLYASNGVANGNEFLVNTGSRPCANPSVAAAADGSFMVAWGAKDVVVTDNSWDIYARSFTNASGGAVVRVNSHLYGDQYAPRISAIGGDYMIVWTSLGQDGSREGVFGQFVHEDGSLVGGELQVNTTTGGQQMQPVVTSDGAGQFLVIWTGNTFSASGFDLFAQRYLNVGLTCNAPGAPFVNAPFTLSNGVYQPQLAVSWPLLAGISVSNYQVYVDGAVTNMGATAATNNTWTMTAANGLATNSTHWFQLAYTTMNGCQSPLSAATTNSTWFGLNWGGIPYEWMAEFYGGYYRGAYYTSSWPSANSPAASGGPTLLQLFQTGGNPFDSSTWLQAVLTRTPQGMYLNWNTQPGFTYQVQVTTNFTSWGVVPNASARFATGTNDSIYVGGVPAGYYRVQLLR